MVLQILYSIIFWRSRRRARQEASERELQNLSTSLLHRLPPELLLCILDQLPGADSICFRASCRKVRACRTTTTPSKDDKQEVYLKILSDEEHRCQIAGGVLKDLKELVCGACKIRHARSYFTEREQEMPCVFRVCFGAQGRLRLCPSRTVTLDELKKELSVSALQDVPGVFCNCPSCSVNPNYATYLCQNPYVFDGVHFSRYMDLLDGPRDTMTPAAMRTALKVLDYPVCPHLRTSDPYVFETLWEDASKSSWFSWYLLWDYCKCECPNADCNTVISTVTTWPFGRRYEDKVYMEISKELGQLKATDPKWRAQLEI